MIYIYGFLFIKKIQDIIKRTLTKFVIKMAYTRCLEVRWKMSSKMIVDFLSLLEI